MRYSEPNLNKSIIDSLGKAAKDLRLWIQNVTRRQMTSGTGSPEGVVDAIQNAQYIDTASDLLYYKRDADIAGDTTKGWRQVL